MFGKPETWATLEKCPISATNSPESLRPAAPEPAAGEHLRHFGYLFGACPAMWDMFRTLERLAPSNAPAMILGESGSGKELVATTLHQLSPRRDRPYIALNCGALPENLIESELFGHERGSFTGAARTHRGCFERADGGTLLLDEVTEMPIQMQLRLLRVLETGRFSRVGSNQEVTADVRVLAASNRDMRQAVAAGRLREDLMYRLCVIPIVVPPLRERGDDAVLLAEMFLAELNAEYGLAKTLTADARRRIATHAWPGNVRELKNVVHRAFVLSDRDVEVDVDRFTLVNGSSAARVVAVRLGAAATDHAYGVGITVGMSLDDAEQALITATLRTVGGSKPEAARMLGVSVKTIYNRLHVYGNRRNSADPTVAKRARLALVA